MAAASNDDDCATLARAIDLSLQGDVKARCFLEGLAMPDLDAGLGPLLSLWQASLQLFANAPDGTPYAYFIACLLRRNVRQQWGRTPPGTRAQLTQGTWETLCAYVQRRVENSITPSSNGNGSSNGILAELVVDPALSQLVSVVVAQSVAIEEAQAEAHASTRTLLTLALQYAQNITTSSFSSSSSSSSSFSSSPSSSCQLLQRAKLLVSLLVLSSLAEEAKEGFGGKLGESVLPEAGSNVCELAVQAFLQAPAAAAATAATASVGEAGALVVVGARALTGWAVFGGVGWWSLSGIGQALKGGLDAMEGGGEGRREGRVLVKVADAMEDMAGEVVGKVGESGGEEEERGGGGMEDEEARAKDEALAQLVGAYMSLFCLARGQEDPLYHAARALVHLLRLPRVRGWVMSTHPSLHRPLVLEALGTLLQGAGVGHRPTSSVCLEVWMDLHRVGLDGRPVEFCLPLYERLLQVVLVRAQWEEGEGEEEEREDEEGEEEGMVGWGEYREQTMYEVLFRCYDVMRSRYIEVVVEEVERQQQQQQQSSSWPWRPCEALIFSFRVIALDCVRRALLPFSPPHAVVNATRITNRALGLSLPPDLVRADGEKSYTLLLRLLHSLLSLASSSSSSPSSSPSSLPPKVWVAIIRALSPLGQILAKAAGNSSSNNSSSSNNTNSSSSSSNNSKDLPIRVMHVLITSLQVPSCRKYTALAIRNIATRCAPFFIQQQQQQQQQLSPVLVALIEALHTTPFASAEDATIFTTSILSLLPPSHPPSLPTPLTAPLLARLSSFASSPPSLPSSLPRLLSDLAILSTLLQRLSRSLALVFLQQAWTPLSLLTTISSSFPPSSSSSPLALALLDTLSCAATLPLSVRAQHRCSEEEGEGEREEGVGVLVAVIRTLQEGRMRERAPVGFVRMCGEVLEAWGPAVESGQTAGEEGEGLALLLDEVGKCVEEVEREGGREEEEVREAVVLTWSGCLDACPGAMMRREGFRGEMGVVARWASSFQTHGFAQAAMVLLTRFVEMPQRLRLEEDGEEDREEGGGRELLGVWRGVMEGMVLELSLFLVAGLMGTAPETTLDALSQLLRTLLLRFHSLILPVVEELGRSAAVDPTPTSSSFPPSHLTPAGLTLWKCLKEHPGLHSRLLRLLQRATPSSLPSSSSSFGSRKVEGGGAWMDLSLFRDLGLDVWAYCQGSKGLDVLDGYL